MNSPQRSSPARNNTEDFMSNFDPGLIHHVLLTDPTDFPNLTMSGKPRAKKTPTFTQHAHSVGFPMVSSGESSRMDDENGESAAAPTPQSREDQISQTMRRAFHDMVVQSLSSKDWGSLQQLILELHGEIRALIPRRTDLHNILNDEEIRNLRYPATTLDDDDADDDGSSNNSKYLELTVKAYLPHIIKAAMSLAQLESEDRSETTSAWIADARRVVESFTEGVTTDTIYIGGGGGGMKPLPYLVCSVTYLQIKAQMCRADVADFHLSRTLAPRIQALGVPYEQNVFYRRFGLMDHNGGMAVEDITSVTEKLPVTWEWVKGMVQKSEYGVDELRQSEEKRVKLVQAVGWVDSILFFRGGEDNGNSNEVIRIPEVLMQDVGNIHSIRDATRVAVNGSALALHASTIAGGNIALTSSDQALPAHVEARKKNLLDVMAQRAAASRDLYENRVAEAVVELAEAMATSPLSTTAVEILTSRTKATMRGEDPVIKLLDNRMKEVFRGMVVWNPQTAQATTNHIPVQMKTGRSILGVIGENSGGSDVFRTQFLKEAQREFTRKGFSIYASDLSQTCLMATKVIHLMCLLYGEIFISKMILMACSD
mmetsp:Transcript_37938/g.56787  ORF Transcript_37938/g.56787 Transcript_37938/m.56787 type:complete len:598 (-) Transcript_37938:103-1896(-)